jgi:hypothetical protein
MEEINSHKFTEVIQQSASKIPPSGLGDCKSATHINKFQADFKL